MRKLFVFALALAVIAVAPTWAQKEAGHGVLMAVDAAGNTVADPGGAESTPDSFLDLDITGVEHWDGLDSPNNTVLTEVLGPGASMTGIGWNVTLETQGGSWLSEAVTYFDGQDLDGSGLFLTVGVGVSSPGTQNFDSLGVLDLTDNGIPDIPVGTDETLYIQFFESFDDVTDAVDSLYIDDPTVTGDSIYTIAGIGFVEASQVLAIPTLSTLGLLALFLGIAAVGFYLLRR
jgi:hypothetical protein